MRLALFILFFATAAFGQFGTPRDIAFWGKRANPCVEAHLGYVVNQTFEGVGYDNCETWTVTGATVDPDYTGVVLQGLQSLRITNSSNIGRCFVNLTNALSEVWVYLLVRPITIDTGSGQILFTIRNNVDNVKANAIVNTSGTITINATTSATTVGTIANGVTYHFWMHRKKATAGDGVWDIGFSTTGIRPVAGNNFVQLTGQSNTDDAYQFDIGYNSGAATQEYVFDRVLVATSQIGDNP